MEPVCKNRDLILEQVLKALDDLPYSYSKHVLQKATKIIEDRSRFSFLELEKNGY